MRLSLIEIAALFARFSRLSTISLFVYAVISGTIGHGQELPKPASDSDYPSASAAKVNLGRLLFYDRILSGNYRVSCAACHSHESASSNGFLLDGEEEPGGDTLAVNSLPLWENLKPSARHAPVLFNLGHSQFTQLFSDGSVADENSTFKSPAAELPDGLQDVLAVQSLFPAVTADELVGSVDNDGKAIIHSGNADIWAELTARVQDLPEYWSHFRTAYPGLKTPKDISIADIANAISSFIAFEWRSDDAPFDRYLKGEADAMTSEQKRGMKLFYGRAECSTCHSGVFQTDHSYHNTGFPVWRFDGVLDDEETSNFDDRLGRFEVTKKAEDRYRFRTPSLRNVARTAPYGYAGSFQTLEETLTYHMAPREGLDAFTATRAGEGLTDENKMRAEALANTAAKASPKLSADELSDLIAFLRALTDETGLHGRLGKPRDVPSSLALD